MASGEESDSLILNNAGESTLKEFLSDANARHMVLQHDDVDDSGWLVPKAVDSSQNHYLNELPSRIRIRIWGYLDVVDLMSVSGTCTKFRQEAISFYRTKIASASPSPIQNAMNILPFTPLHRYLDAEARNTLRLVCKRLKTMMDFYDERDRNKCRWCGVTKVPCLGYSGCGCSADINPTKSMPAVCKKSNIFDLHVQDLKRIFGKLDKDDLESLEKVCGVFCRIVQELKDYPFEEFQENLFQLNLMDLPFEVHEKIINFCKSSDRQKLRLVSKLMQFQVDTLAGVEVHLNDLKWGWNSSCGRLPPAFSLIITNVESIQAVTYFINEDNWKLLTRVVLDGKVPAKAFIHILEKCKNLRYVGFTHALQMSSIEDELRKSFPVKRTPLELLSLRAINLKVQEVDFPSDNIFRVHSWTWANAFEIMKPGLLYIPRLTSFYLCEETIITHNLMYEVAEKVLKFILEHRHTLKYISVILNGNCLRSCGCPPFHFQVKDETVKELKLAKFSQDCDWRISRPFISILNAQRSLKELSCFKLSDWEFYAGVISNNKLSLRSVTIEKNLAPEIDLSAFSSCTNLEHLWISQYGSSNLGQQNSNYLRSIRFDQRLANLITLPISIKSLHILDQTVEAEQIKTIPQRLKNLEVLDLQFLGTWDGKSFGMSTETVSEILQLRKLNCLFLEEIRMLDSCSAHVFETALSEINLIPTEFSQIMKTFDCLVYGILIAESLPNADYMPEWEHRVSSYFDSTNTNAENYYYFNQDYYRAENSSVEDEAEYDTFGEQSGEASSIDDA